jgi:phosphotransferase system enzyme I (PtsI)
VSSTSVTFHGLGCCGGIAFGRVHLVDRRRVSVPRYHLTPDKIDSELERFEKAIVVSEGQLSDLHSRAKKTGLGEVEMLLEAHGMILRDQFLRDATRERIAKEGLNAEWALKETLKKIRQIFDGLDEDYFKERRSDVDLVSDRVLRNLVGAETELLNNLSEDAIVVAYDLSPADTVALARFKAIAFVTEAGGKTSHTAILARAMNTPAVLGVHGIMDRAGFGDEIVVDGYSGEVVLRPTQKISARFRVVGRRRAKEEEALLADRHLPAETTDGARMQLLGNIEVGEEIQSVLAHGGEGIGLYRTEFLVIERHRMPSAQEHAEEYTRLARELEGRLITIRTIDIGGDKFMRAQNGITDGPTPAVSNPALGLRAIRYSLREVETFKNQLRGILSASGPHHNVRLLLPLVTCVDEVRQARAILEETKRELASEGKPFDPALPFGIMVETPAAVTISDLLVREVDFISIGTNDLIQYAFAVDRGNDDVAYLYRPSDPAVLRMVRSVCQAARVRDVSVTLCGEMAADPFHVPLLIGLGVRSLSMSAHAIPMVKRLVRRLSAADCEALVDRALSLPTAAEVEREVAQRLQVWSPELFGAPAPKASN